MITEQKRARLVAIRRITRARNQLAPWDSSAAGRAAYLAAAEILDKGIAQAKAMIIRGSLPVWWLARVHVPSGTAIERRPAMLICADEDSSAATVEWNGQRYAVTIDQLKLREDNNGKVTTTRKASGCKPILE